MFVHSLPLWPHDCLFFSLLGLMNFEVVLYGFAAAVSQASLFQPACPRLRSRTPHVPQRKNEYHPKFKVTSKTCPVPAATFANEGRCHFGHVSLVHLDFKDSSDLLHGLPLCDLSLVAAITSEMPSLFGKEEIEGEKRALSHRCRQH